MNMKYYIKLYNVDGYWLLNELFDNLSDYNCVKLFKYICGINDTDIFENTCINKLKYTHLEYYFLYEKGLKLVCMYNKVTDIIISDIDIIAFETFTGQINDLMVSIDYQKDEKYEELVYEIHQTRKQNQISNI